MGDTVLQHAIQLLAQLVAFDSTSRNSNLPIIYFIRDYLAQHGIASQLIPDATGQKANLFARIGPEAKGGYILSGHTDVVPVDGQSWDTEPFVLTEKGGKLFGRGTADMKSFAAICLALVPEWVKQPLKKPIYLAFSYDEEVGCLGAPSLAQFIREQKIEPELAIIGEPTSMQVVTAHKGIASFETVITGVEAHSSNTHKGINAIALAAEIIHFLNGMAREYQASPPDMRFDPPYTTIHVGTIQGGTARNIIPKECRFLWEIRPVPGDDKNAIYARYEQFAQALLRPYQAQFPACGIQTRPASNVAGLALDPARHEHVAALTGANHFHAVSFGTEAGIYTNAGFASIVCGPGSIDQAHQPNEYIEIAQIDACIQFLQKLGVYSD